MPLVTGYHRPTSIEEALGLLRQGNRLPLAGGTTINADRAASDLEVVDLQGLGLSGIAAHGDRVDIGSTTTLQAVADHFGSHALGEIAQAEAPSTLRTLATVGGTIAGRDPDSRFIAALLVHDAAVEFAGGSSHPLTAVLGAGVASGAIITGVSIASGGVTAHSATGRTPADTPIVAAVGRNAGATISLALTGVATTPVLVDAADPIGTLSPAGDFRGSAAYRLELASVLSQRVIEGLR